MGDKADSRHILVHIGRDGGHHIAVLIKLRFNAQGVQFIAQESQQVQLLVRARLALGFLVRLCVHCYVAQEFLD